MELKELYISGEAQSSGGVIAFDQAGAVADFELDRSVVDGVDRRSSGTGSWGKT